MSNTPYAAKLDGEWLVPSRWHIDDVKGAIQDSESANRPMPSDEQLMEYLFYVVANESWIQEMNEQLAMQLDDLFPKEEKRT